MRNLIIILLLLAAGVSCSSRYARTDPGFDREAKRFERVLKNTDQAGQPRPDPVTREATTKYNRELRTAGFSFLDVSRDLERRYVEAQDEIERLEEEVAELAPKAAQRDAAVWIFFIVLILAVVILVLRLRYGGIMDLAGRGVSAISSLPGLITSWFGRK